MCMPSNSEVKKALLRILGWVTFISIVFYILFTRHFSMVLVMGDSMDPHMEDKELIIMHRTYEGWIPQRYDVVVVWDDADKDKMVKRIIGLPNEKIELSDRGIYLNGEKLRRDYWYKDGDYMDEEVEIPEGYVWVIGDNRRHSWYGLIPIKDILGRVLF